jgi:ribA/ribD-fused uncharacterized protein
MKVIREFRAEYRFLSNFHPASVELDGLEYPTVEHAFQAAKTGDPAQRERIRTLPGPHQAKKAGRALDLRPDWERVKIGVMEELVRRKFTRHAELRELLLATGDQELMEGNRWNDRFWGVDLDSGEGENHLGKILMKVRRELRPS